MVDCYGTLQWVYVCTQVIWQQVLYPRHGLLLWDTILYRRSRHGEIGAQLKDIHIHFDILWTSSHIFLCQAIWIWPVFLSRRTHTYI